MKKIKVVIIDPFTKTVYEKKINQGLESLYKTISAGCKSIEAVRIDGFTGIFVDEEGTFDGHAEIENMKCGFMLKNYKYPIWGTGVIVGFSKEGDTIDSFLTERGAINLLHSWVYKNLQTI